MLMQGTYDYSLVLISYLIAAIAAYITLGDIYKLRQSSEKSKSIWLILGAVTLGTGIWSMHFIGMIAYKMNMLMQYDLALTLLSVVIAMATSGFAIWFMRKKELKHKQIVAAALIMGAGISSMHYIGMDAMIMQATIVYDQAIVATSIMIAIGASYVAIWIATQQDRFKLSESILIKIITAMILGVAICGMHYTGMSAASYYQIEKFINFENVISGELMALWVGVMTVLILILGVITSNIENENGEMTGKIRLLITLIILVFISMVISGVTSKIFYDQGIKAEKGLLLENVNEISSLVGAVGRFDIENSEHANNKGAKFATLSQVLEAYKIREADRRSSLLINTMFLDESVNGVSETALIYDLNGVRMVNNFKNNHAIEMSIEKAMEGRAEVFYWKDHETAETQLYAFHSIPSLGMVLVMTLSLDRYKDELNKILYTVALVTVICVIAGAIMIMGLMNPLINTLRKSKNELEQEITDRTKEIQQTNEKLQEEINNKEKAEHEIRKLMQLEEKILDSTTNGILVIGIDRMVSRLNVRACEITAKDYSQLMAVDIMSLVDETDKDKLDKELQRVFDNGETIHGVELNIQNNKIIIEAGLAPIFDAAKIIGAVCTFEDVTQRREISESLLNSKEQAEASSKSKSEFLANMSHEIRTPMNGVLGMLNLLTETDLNREQREYAETAYNSGELLMSILNDILDFSKIEAGKLEIEKTDFDVIGTIEDVSGLLAERAHIKNNEINHEVSNEVPRFLIGDPTRLRQVLINLIGNAIKFTSNGEIISRIKLLGRLDKKVRIRFEITDTGIGIESSAQARIFEAFSQEDGTTTRRFGGTGLGLSISKQIVGLMDGDIGVISEMGKGSTFWFEVELGVSEMKQENEEVDHDLSSLKVLIVDDNKTNRIIYQNQLRHWGCESEACEFGVEGVAKIKSAIKNGKPYDLMLLDYMMPMMDGIEVANEIRSLEQRPVIIMLTSMCEDGARKKSKEVGVEITLTKPVRNSLLFDSISSLMTTRKNMLNKKKVESRKNEKIKPDGVMSTTRILLAEDNLINQKVAVGMLKKIGYAAVVVSNGAEAVDKCSHEVFDLIFMDCQMPVMDGYEATQAIRRDKLNRKTTIVAMTANAMQGDREKCIESGMNDYITKPIKPGVLLEVMEKWLVVT